jgi:hypothetical protein
MPEQLTPEQMQAMSPEERQEYQQRQLRERKWCHRSFRSHMLAIPVQDTRMALPGREGGTGVQVQMVPATLLCEQESCMLWDAKKRRCLDRSAAIAVAYGKENQES